MCEPTWMVASFQSTRDPFIQILPVPGNPICLLLYLDLIRPHYSRRVWWSRGHAGRRAAAVLGEAPLGLLRLSAERASRGARLERLAAMPAEPRLRGFAGAKSRLDLGHVCFFRRRDVPLAPCRRKQIRQQVGSALVPLRRVRRERLQDDVVYRLRNPVVLHTRRGDQLAAN